jgi:hypothetical protein
MRRLLGRAIRPQPGVRVVGPALILAGSVPEYSGTAHSDMGTVPPACKIIPRDEPYVVRKSNGGVQPTVDLNDPNHLTGQKVIEDPNNKSTTTIRWDLSRDP